MAAQPSIDPPIAPSVGASLGRALVELFDAAPSRFDSAEVRAAWITRKANLMRRIAAEATNPTIAEQASAEAARADRQAARLITEARVGS